METKAPRERGLRPFGIADRPGSQLDAVLRLARKEPSAVLLAAQLGGVLLYPFMEDSDAGRALFSLFGIAILGLVLLAVRSSPAWTWFGVVLAIPAGVLLVIQAVSRSDALRPRRRDPGQAVRAIPRDARTTGRRRLPRDGGVAAGEPDVLRRAGTG
jgi:hypothetical protein